VKPPGFSEKNDLLNVLGINATNHWYAFDPLTNCSDIQNSYYHWLDLYVGAEMDVYSRKVVLSNCDKFTRQYYSDCGLGGTYEVTEILRVSRIVYGYNSDNTPSVDAPNVTEEKDEPNVRDKPTRTDDDVLNKLLKRSNVEALVFKAKIVVEEPDGLNREFVVKCFLSDQSFSVSETNVRTAGKLNVVTKSPIYRINFVIMFVGALGCRFFSKRKIPIETPDEPNVIFKLYVGVELTIDNFKFVFVDVEDRTLRFMMDHPTEVRLHPIAQNQKLIFQYGF